MTSKYAFYLHISSVDRSIEDLLEKWNLIGEEVPLSSFGADTTNIGGMHGAKSTIWLLYANVVFFSGSSHFGEMSISRTRSSNSATCRDEQFLKANMMTTT